MTTEGIRKVSAMHRGFEIDIRTWNRTDRFGCPQQYIAIRLRNPETGNIVRWTGTAERWNHQIGELVNELREMDSSPDLAFAQESRARSARSPRRRRESW